MKSVVSLSLAIVIGTSALAQTPRPQEPPPRTTFKSSVDLVRVDVSVVDRSGRPVDDLTPADFGLAVDGKPRKIVSAQFIAVSRTAEPAEAAPANYSSNELAAGGRLIMMVIDQGNIGASRGKFAAEAAARFISRLRKSDRVGLFAIPGAGPQIDFTANHALVQTLLPRIIGQASADHGPYKIGLAEALAVDRGDEQMIAQVLERECAGAASAEERRQCRNQITISARAMFGETRTRARESMLALRHVMERLSRTDTPKTVVFISEGVLIDRELSDVTWIGPVASRGQVSLYVLQLEPPQFEAAGGSVSPSRGADIDLGQEGLGLIAGLARGSVFRVVTNADFAFNRLALELSGYYLLSFEPQAGDRDGKTHKIKIELPARKNVAVRSRREFSVDTATVKTTDEVLAALLRSPLLTNDMGLKATTYVFKDPASQKMKIVIASEIDRSLNPRGSVALAYTLVDANGTLVSSQVESDVTSPLRNNRTQIYSGAVVADAGVYTLRVAVVDDTGKRGSVEHTFRAQLTSAGQIRVTDLMIAESGGPESKSVTPAVSGEISGDVLQGYIELHSEAPEQINSATAVIEVAESEHGRTLDSAAAHFQDAPGGPTRRVAEAGVTIALLPPGSYVARAVVSSGGRKIAQVNRPFRIVRSSPTATTPAAAAGVTPGHAPPVPFASPVDTFERSSVLAGPVVGFFLDKMNVGNRVGNAPPAALEAARAGKFEAALDAMKSSGATPLALQFVSGLALYQKGDLEGAAGKFRESLRLDSEFFPAAFYLGACFAAGGKDREAAGTWRTSLITQSDAPFIYTLLADAFLRLKETASALDILGEASNLWPNDDSVRMRLGIAQAAAGQPAEAIATLDPYLVKHPEDHPTLLVALRTIYEVRSAGKTIGTAETDRRRFVRYAAAYFAASGPQRPLVEQWKRFVDR